MQNVSWLNPAGGLRYHLRALRYRNSMWLEFREELARWLESWQPREKELVLVGPSAGHCLDDGFLQRFTRIVAIDPDPMARHLFTWRYGSGLSAVGCELRWDHEDYFRDRNGSLDLLQTKLLLEQHPGSAVLFCNFLGQLKVLNENDVFGSDFEEWKKGLHGLLSGRSWASFHDRVSGPAEPFIEASPKEAKFLSNDEIIEVFYASHSNHGGSTELLDHLTEGLFPGHEYSYLRWQITPGIYHVIEAVHANG